MLLPEEAQAFKAQADAVLTAEDDRSLRIRCKKLLVLCWANLTERDRREFHVRLDYLGDMGFVPPEKARAGAATDELVTRILDRWDQIIPKITEKKAAAFAQDVNKRRRWKNWAPTEKQEQFILSLWRDHMAEGASDDPELVE